MGVVLVFALGVAGCNFGCTSGIVYGVEILIDEPGGPYMEPVSIRYRVDGDVWHDVPDTSDVIANDVAECPLRSRCYIGAEQEGVYEVEVRRGRASAMFETIVSTDSCHVNTVTIPLSLPAT